MCIKMSNKQVNQFEKNLQTCTAKDPINYIIGIDFSGPNKIYFLINNIKIMLVHKLTNSQAASVSGHILPSGQTVEPVLDADGNYILSTNTVDQITDTNFQWVKNCPLIEYNPAPIILFKPFDDLS